MLRAALLACGLPLVLAALLAGALAGVPPSEAPSTLADSGLSEAALWLRDYLRIDTTNPPGGEQRSAAFLASILHRAGIATRTFYTPEGRASLYARLPANVPGTVSGESLVLLHHMDVVAPGPGWTVDPFAGAILEGRMWGRGAVDAKSLGIAHLAALIDLQRSRTPRRRDIVFLAVADEESGGAQGTGWLLDHHPELFEDVAAVLNEGGANLVLRGSLQWWGIEVAQKRPLWLEVTATGREGHGAGGHPWSATHRLLRALNGLLAMKIPWRVTQPVRDYLEGLAPLHDGTLHQVFSDPDTYIKPDGPTVRLLPGLSSHFLDSVQITVLEGSHRINILPASARAQVDIRLLPETDADDFLSRVRAALGDEVQTRILVEAPASEASPTDHPVYRLLERQLEAEAPVVPAFIGGFTDSRYFRQRGIPAYGIAPFAAGGEDLSGIHAADERLSLEELDRGIERVKRLVAVWARGDAE